MGMKAKERSEEMEAEEYVDAVVEADALHIVGRQYRMYNIALKG